VRSDRHDPTRRESGPPRNGPFQFQKRRQLFIRSHNETLSVVSMRVCNPDRSAPAILSDTLAERVHEMNVNDNANEEVRHERRDKSSIG